MKFYNFLGAKKQVWAILKRLFLNRTETQFNFYKKFETFSDYLM